MSEQGAAGRYESGQAVGGGRYQLLDLLGEGGMASVHLAHDSVLDRQVAIKTLHTELGREASFRERFRREAQSVAKLSHTNIVSVFDSGEDLVNGSTVPYIVMEYVEGKPLRSVLDEDVAQHGAMPTDKALKIASDVLAALDVSHEMGLVHRDIKPGNVMITKRGVVKVMDFGIARAMQSGVTSMTQTGMVVGTPQYLSPEQALGRGVDARSDLYSVGCLLFELLTGRLPFDGDSPLAIAYQHVQQEPSAPSTINRSLPPAVDALVARALKKNPNERFPTAQAMQDEATRVSGNGPSGANPVIVGSGPAHPGGAAVASAVFPPASTDPNSAQASGVQQPYQPPASGQYGGFGPATPPPGTGQYGYGHPHVAASPQPGASTPMYGGTGPATPPPYASPAATPPPGRGGGNKPVIIGSALVVLLAVIAVTVVLVTRGGDSGDQAEHGGDSSPTQQTDDSSDSGSDDSEDSEDSGGSDGSKIVQGDKSKVIEKIKCTEATESDEQDGAYYVPDFQNLYVDSVKACIRAAGWKYKVVPEDENVWGKGTVTDYTYRGYEPYDPKTDTIQLTVSTGKPAT